MEIRYVKETIFRKLIESTHFFETDSQLDQLRQNSQALHRIYEAPDFMIRM